MPNVDLSAADADDLRQAAIRLAEHGEHVLAGRLEALARYVATATKPASRAEAPLPGPRPRDFGQVYEDGEEVTA
jgi:hypothetical protein